MGSPSATPRRFSLRLRFAVASALLLVTTLIVGASAAAVLSRLNRLLETTMRGSDEATDAIASVASGLEREDDALLVVLSGEATAMPQLADARATVDTRVDRLDNILDAPEEQDMVDALRRAIRAYRTCADRVVGTDPEVALVRYHREANPPLRDAVAKTSELRDRYFDRGEAAIVTSQREAHGARNLVVGVSAIALIVAAAITAHLTRRVVRPIAAMTKSARAIADERFDERLALTPGDELGDLARAFNDMAEHLGEFRRTNAAAVLRAKAALEATLRALPEAVLLVDSDDRIVSQNDAATKLFGVVTEQPLAKLSLGPVALESLLGTSVPERVDLSRAVPVVREGLSTRLLARQYAVREGEAGRIVVVYDVTDLARLDETRSELLAVASHELRTPLTTLRMTLAMLAEKQGALSERQRDIVATCSAGVDQLEETVDEFLDLARIETGKLRLERQPLDVEVLLRATAARWMARACDSGVVLEVASAPGLTIDGDERRLRAVLDNLVSNAVKYAPAGSTISVRAVLDDDRVVLEIADHGRGVPERFRLRVFEKFFRVEHHVADEEEGTRGVGIGLYLSREIVEAHGGSISCKAGPGGKGAVFVAQFPPWKVRAFTKS